MRGLTKLEAPIVTKCYRLMDHIGPCFEGLCELTEACFEEEENIIYLLVVLISIHHGLTPTLH